MSSIPKFVEGKAKFNELVLECIDDGLKDIFGEMGAKLILDYLNCEGSLSEKESKKRWESIRKDLRRLLGSGAVVVEQAVLKILHSKLVQGYSNLERNSIPDLAMELENLICS